MGPYIDVFRVDPAKPAAIGRTPACDVCLVHEAVSRRHATLLPRAGTWFIVDERSGGGTFLNGIRLQPAEPSLLTSGDLLRIGPWTFRVDVAARATSLTDASHFNTIDDRADSALRVERIQTKATSVAVERLRLITECLERLHAARSESDLASTALDCAMRGSSFPRGAILAPGDSDTDVRIIAAKGLDTDPATPDPAPVFSRSLLFEAAKGHVVMLGESSPASMIQSIAQHRIEAALCCPVLLGDAVCGYIYLDARQSERPLSSDSAPFCEAVARAYGLALANLKRSELERRQAELTAELHAARDVQSTITPPPSGRVSFVNYAVHVQPGLFVAGDLFDIFSVGDHVAVCLGDVSGHGVGSGMLMAATQAHLSAFLRASGNLVAAVESLNTYLCDHSSGGRFVSLLVALIDASGQMRFIDAGHGHWHVQPPLGPPADPPAPAFAPLGLTPNAKFVESTLNLGLSNSLVLYSDGILEQRSSSGDEFGRARLELALLSPHTSPTPHAKIQSILGALNTFAPGGRFSDDATVAIVTLDGHPRN